MKNIVKVSFAAACALVLFQTNSFANENLATAFENGKVNGKLKSYYFAKSYDNNTYQDASIWVNGIDLGYKTGSFYGFSFGTTAQFASVTSIDDKNNRYAPYMDGSGAIMSEIYLSYTYDKTTAKAGRQYFGTPLVAGSGSRFIRQSFEGYSIENTSLDNTKIVAAYLTKFADRTDNAGSPGKFGDGRIGVDGAWTVYAKNNSINNLTLQAQYAERSEKVQNADNGAQIFYGDGLYNFGGDMKPFVAAQYLTTTYDQTGIKDGDAYGIKIGATFFGLNTYAAFTSVGNSSVEQGIGSGAIPLYTNGETVDAWSATLSDTDAYKLGLSYKIDSVILSGSFASYDRKNVPKVTETNFTATYNVTKNLSAQLQYSMLNNEYIVEKDIDTDLRTRLVYSF
ncbi:MAG: OprD family outer membrane porin [Aliarcobacter sp.]|nr:OprD family outer membrane porin [Aliarcobacter sp.]